MAPENSSTDTSQSSTATSQTSTAEAKSTVSVTDEGAQIMISIIAKEIPFLSDEQCRIIHEEIGGCVSCFSVSCPLTHSIVPGVLTLDAIKQSYLRSLDTSGTGSYTPVAFRESVQGLLGRVTTVVDKSTTVTVLDDSDLSCRDAALVFSTCLLHICLIFTIPSTVNCVIFIYIVTASFVSVELHSGSNSLDLRCLFVFLTICGQ